MTPLPKKCVFTKYLACDLSLVVIISWLGVHRDCVVEIIFIKISALAVQGTFPANVDWSTRSPNTSLLMSSCLWGYLKSKVYAHQPRTQGSHQIITANPQDLTLGVLTLFSNRLGVCIDNNG